ncbi:MAG: hypothetical protein K6T63_15185 [Alicyclobacillus herbarius]|uniref:hypothetical protein n=1 Tax=Alicyclobacillus herbarius TaxID=122960 RepID=UPI0023527300|nr:hypothetical protein [Alicyclobacillus herbarius]MCL6633960.1 hypothetical protein [Alicyclobacillus herbarius]
MAIDPEEIIEQQPYDRAKFFTAMRWRLRDMQLPASAIALLVALHTVCDADTGTFTRRDLVTVRRITLLPKQTVSWAFRRLLERGLVTVDETVENADTYIITHYEEDRRGPHGYFRLTPNLIRQLPEMVARHNPKIILFALELLDRGRVYGAEMIYSMKKLIRDWRLGSCPSRVMKQLELLAGIALYAKMPNAKGDGENLHFDLVKDEDYSEEQEKWRSLHGRVSAETKRAFQFASRQRNGRPAPTWRELARTTRLIIRYGLDNQLTDVEMVRIAGLFGTTCVVQDVRRPVPYLRRALPDLHNKSKLLVRSWAS